MFPSPGERTAGVRGVHGRGVSLGARHHAATTVEPRLRALPAQDPQLQHAGAVPGTAPTGLPRRAAGECMLAPFLAPRPPDYLDVPPVSARRVG